MTINTLLQITTIISNLAAIGAMIFAAVTFRIYVKQNRNMAEQVNMMKQQMEQDERVAKAQLERQKKNDTIVFVNSVIKYTDDIYSEIRQVFQNETINLSDPRYDDAMKKHVTIYLRMMERLAVGINTKTYDIDVYARMCRKKTIATWNQLMNVIQEARRKSVGFQPYEEL